MTTHVSKLRLITRGAELTGIGWLVVGVASVAPPAHAGETVLRNNDHEAFDYADYTERMLEGECFGSVFVPDDGSIPFTLKYVDAMIGGSTETKVFTVDFYEVDVDQIYPCIVADVLFVSVESSTLFGLSQVFFLILLSAL